jgi:hypothetical protein
MTKSDFINVLTEKIDKYEIDEFFRVLTTSIDTTEYDIESLQEEWDKIKKTENFGLFDRNQSIAAFKSFFIKYSNNHLSTLTDKDIKADEIQKDVKKENTKLIDKEIEEKYFTSTINNETSTENELYEVENNVGKRPTIITILCVLGAISIFRNLFGLTGLSELGIQMDGFLIFINVFQLAIHGVHLFGLWHMKKWSVIIYAINVIIGFMVSKLSYPY